MKENNTSDLDTVVQQALEQATETATKKAVDTLHPKDSVHADRLTNLQADEVAGHSIMEWTSLLLNHGADNKKFILDGFSEKLKALKVSKDGRGRGEVSTIFKPEVIGAMLQQGMIPQQGSIQQPQQQRQGLGRRFF